MYLKSIEIQGFKSFANKIKFEFHNGITGIVGPNGSGKSNVADAVRWVLGEQKTKSLRSSKMEDVIFAGTENRKPLGFAYVAITLDNSDHKLDSDYEEITVSRRLFRSGESEYMINGSQVRLKDVNELFYDTGIGKEGYSIIGQGQVERILSGKPEERRELIDEAAGIVKFKRRKNDALKKLNDQNQNLVRVEDILSELERRVGPLGKQAETAKKYLSFKDELKKNDVNMFLIDLEDIKGKLQENEEKTSIANDELFESQKEFEKIKLEYSKLEQIIEDINNQIESKKERLNESTLEKQKVEGQILLLEEQIKSAKSNEDYISARVDSVNKEIDEKKKEIQSLTEAKASVEQAIREHTDNQSSGTNDLLVLNEELDEIESQKEKYKSEIIELLNAKSLVQSKMERCDALLEQINVRKSQISEKLSQFESDKANQESIIADLETELKEVADSIIEVNEKANSYKEDLIELRRENQNLSSSIDRISSEYHRATSMLDTTKGLAERYDGYNLAIKKVMEMKTKNKGIIGVVADIITVDKKYEVAIETALGGSIQNIVTDTETTAKEMIEYLKTNKFGRATFLPLSSMSNKVGFNNMDALNDRGVIGLASDLVSIKSEYSGVTKFLLGRILVVDTIDNATFIARKYRYTLRIVTLDGEILSPGGAMTGGKYKNQSVNLLGRKREIDELEDKVEKLTKEKNDLNKQLTEVRSRISVVSNEAEKIKTALQEQLLLKKTLEMNIAQANSKKNDLINEFKDFSEENADIIGRIDDINKNSSELSEELAGCEDRNLQLENLIKELSVKSESKRTEIEEGNQKLEKIKLEIASLTQKHNNISDNIKKSESELNELNNELDSIKSDSSEAGAEIDARKESINNLKKKITQIDEDIETFNTEIGQLTDTRDSQTKDHKDFFEKREEISDKISTLDKEIYRLNSQRENYEERKDAKVNYMWTEYEITTSEAVKLKDEELTDKSEMKSKITELKRNIKALGDVNVNAIDEFKEVNERYVFMNEQHDDIMKAKENLLNIIAELEDGMRKQFKEKFAEIQMEFDKVFSELFGGGHGRIELTEADDILEAGINIISQPPGKKLQNMMQLSGGEKALTAISLLFAIQNLKPSPFCLLDEIEAALDGSNVVRFAQYLHKLTENTQFIVITHRRGTMGCADRLYGITMQEKGVSALVSVDLLEADLDK